jgi:hypothetical protein
MQDSNSQALQVDRNKMWHWKDVLKVVMNIKNPEQISSDHFLTIN